MSLDFEVFNSKHEDTSAGICGTSTRPVRRHPTRKKETATGYKGMKNFCNPTQYVEKKYTFALAVSDSQYAMNQKNISDSLLISALRNGDIDSYKTIYAKYYAKVRGFALRLTRTEWIADEITQNVFVKIWTHRDSLVVCEQGGNLNGYIFMIAKNEVVNYYRSRQQIIAYQKDFVEDVRIEARIDQSIDPKRLAAVIERIVAALPRTRREVFIMSRYRHMSNAEIALHLGISKRTVEKHISLVLEKLRMELATFLP